MIRVGIDACFWRRGGIARYISKLVTGLSSHEGIMPIAFRDYPSSYESLVNFDDHSMLLQRDQPESPYTIKWFEEIMATAVENKKISIFHGTAYAFPTLNSTPCVVSIHDLSFRRLRHEYGRRLFFYNYWVEKAKRTNTTILTLSLNSKHDIMEMLCIPEDRIHVIPPGVDDKFRPISSCRSIFKKYQIKAPFLLHIGGLNANKNTLILLKVLQILRHRGLNIFLVVVDRSFGNEQTKEFLRKAEQFRVRDMLQCLSYIDDEDLPSLYSAADVFVFPSLYEGFGLPPLEAMACGTPVICSNCSSLPEVVGEAGILVNPVDAESIAIAIEDILTDTNLNRSLITKGIDQAQKYNWQDCIRKTAATYRSIVMD